MRNTQTILCRQSFVEESVPPWQIPWRHLSVWFVRNIWMINLRFTPRHRVEPTPFSIAWHYKTTHSLPFIVRTPKVAPVARTCHIFLINIIMSKPFSNLSNTPVVKRIFYGSCTCAWYAIRNIAQGVVFF